MTSRRNPIETAKALATFDRTSGGRVIAGVGAGWNEAQSAALGVPFHEWGSRTNEYLRLWQAVGSRTRSRSLEDTLSSPICMSARLRIALRGVQVLGLGVEDGADFSCRRRWAYR